MAAFLNSGTKVVNISVGIENPSESVITFITPLLKRLREAGYILTVAAGNNGTNVDENRTCDLFMQFVNRELIDYVDGERRSFRMDNIVAVAACDQDGQLAAFSYYGKETVLIVSLLQEFAFGPVLRYRINLDALTAHLRRLHKLLQLWR